jgi:hypothetical protein
MARFDSQGVWRTGGDIGLRFQHPIGSTQHHEELRSLSDAQAAAYEVQLRRQYLDGLDREPRDGSCPYHPGAHRFGEDPAWVDSDERWAELERVGGLEAEYREALDEAAILAREVR